MKKQHTTLQHLLMFAASLLLVLLTAAVTTACSGNGAPYGYEYEDPTPPDNPDNPDNPSDPEDPETPVVTPELNVDPSTLAVYEAEGGTKTLTVDCNVEWEVQRNDNEPWLTVEKNGNSISVIVAANETTEQRMAQFTVKTVGDNPKEQPYTVIQKGKEIPPTTMELSTKDVQIAYEGTAVEIQVTANASWSVLPGYDDWLTVTVTETTITLTATPNDLYEPRITELTVQTDDKERTETVTVTQAAKPKVVPGEDDNNTPGYSRRSK